VLLRALLHRQTNSWLSEAACSTGSQLLGSALPSAAASYPVGQACISTVPKTTDRTPYRPAPDGSDGRFCTTPQQGQQQGLVSGYA
jgi:hypothetical protein